MGIAQTFRPEFEGVYSPPTLHPQILEGLASRIRDLALFPGAGPRRNRYEVIEWTPTTLSFQSTSLLAGINVGLNDVVLSMDPNQKEISFKVRYWTWTRYCLFLSGMIASLLALFLCIPLWISHALPEGPVGAWILSGIVLMLVFWGLLWPWILVALHKKPAKGCLVHLLNEVQASLTEQIPGVSNIEESYSVLPPNRT